jgi:3-hydroxyisobutyrate dehydrogenase-like beta-hydroxyacid dehydrogenase
MIKLQAKDMRIAREFIRKLDANFPGTELTYKLFTEAVERGLGEQGTQGLVNLFDWQK